jgi:copper chaperone CopZ
MQSNAKTNRTLTIEGMSGDVCIKKVTGALKSVDGVDTKSVGVGHAVVNADEKGCAAACAAVSDAGYRTHNNTHTAQNDQHNSKGELPNANEPAVRNDIDRDNRLASNRGKDSTTNDPSHSHSQQRIKPGSTNTSNGNVAASPNNASGSPANSPTKPAI